MSATIVEMMLSEIRENMDKYIRDYQQKAEHIAWLAAARQFPNRSESDAFSEAISRAKSADAVLAMIEVFGVSHPSLRNRLKSYAHEIAMLGSTLYLSAECDVIYEAVTYLESSDFLRAAGEFSAGTICGDYPAPCNCDNTATHNGH